MGWHLLGVLQMLNVKYVITLNELPHPAFEEVFSGKLFHPARGRPCAATIAHTATAFSRPSLGSPPRRRPRLVDAGSTASCVRRLCGVL